jgi:hypothetical protein
MCTSRKTAKSSVLKSKLPEKLLWQFAFGGSMTYSEEVRIWGSEPLAVLSLCLEKPGNLIFMRASRA